MSRLTELRDNLKNRATEIWSKVQESELYQKLADRYQSLTPTGQKLTKIAAFFLIFLVVVFIPLSQLSVSKDLVAQFEHHRQLIRDMFKAYRTQGSTATLPPPPPADSLISSINSSLQSEQLMPEQITTVSIGASEGRLIPQNLLSEVIEVKLAKLNIRQVVDIGSRLSGLNPAVKMKDLLIQARSEMAGYFDVTYKLYALNVPAAPVEPPPEPEKPAKTKKPSGKTNKDSSQKGDE